MRKSQDRPGREATANAAPAVPEGAVSALVERVNQLVEKENIEEAIGELDAAIRKAPLVPEWWRAKALVLRRLGRVKEALAALDAGIDQIGEARTLLLEKAQIQFVQGDFARSRETYDRLVAVEPQCIEGWLGNGQSALNASDAESALHCANRAVAIDPRSTSGHVLRGDSLLWLGRWADAFAAFTKAATYNHREFDASNWAARGDEFQRKGQPEFALRAYEQAIAQDGNNPEGWYGKGQVLKQREDFKGSLAAFETASKVDKWFIAGFLEAGVLCAERGQSERALEFFERAKEAQPGDSRPWKFIGWVNERLGRQDAARTAYEHAVEAYAADAEAWNMLGNSLYKLERTDEALKSFERARELDPESGSVHRNLASLFLEQRRFDEAIEVIKRATELKPDNNELLMDRLVILSVANRIDEIDFDDDVSRILRAAGDNQNLLVDVAGLLADNDRVDRARDLLRRLDRSRLQDDERRLSLAGSLLDIGEAGAAIDVLRAIDPGRLPRSSMLVIHSFFHCSRTDWAGRSSSPSHYSRGSCAILSSGSVK